jgi:hypothetical protein
VIGTKFTLVAATATKIATGGPGGRSVFIESALTDIVLGGPAVTSATGCLVADVSPGLTFFTGSDDLWAISATGGTVYVLQSENA